MDGISGADNISQLFSIKLEAILNSQDASDRDTLLSSLSASLSADDLTRFLVSLKCFKSDGSAHRFIHALPAIRGFIAMLFTAILRHG